MKPKTFQEILEEEVRKQTHVVTEMEAELKRSIDSPYSPLGSRDVARLMDEIAQERRVLIPLKKVLEAYRKEQEKK